MNAGKIAGLIFAMAFLGGMARAAGADFGPEVVVEVKKQKMEVVDNGVTLAKFPVSTSRFGLGDEFGSYRTPPGTLWVCNKIGGNLPVGAVIKNRRATGEVLAPNAKDRDPIVTRVIWLRGLEPQNKNAYARCIYIHGTEEERLVGRNVSYGCIRMRSKDVITLYNLVQIGTHVEIKS